MNMRANRWVGGPHANIGLSNATTRRGAVTRCAPEHGAPGFGILIRVRHGKLIRQMPIHTRARSNATKMGRQDGESVQGGCANTLTRAAELFVLNRRVCETECAINLDLLNRPTKGSDLNRIRPPSRTNGPQLPHLESGILSSSPVHDDVVGSGSSSVLSANYCRGWSKYVSFFSVLCVAHSGGLVICMMRCSPCVTLLANVQTARRDNTFRRVPQVASRVRQGRFAHRAG
jgi:hypothetical protein